MNKPIGQHNQKIAILRIELTRYTEIIEMYTAKLHEKAEEIGLLSYQLKEARAEGLTEFDDETYKNELDNNINK